MEKINYMQQNPNSQKKCSKHYNYQLDLILIQKGIENNFICFKCLQDKKIDNSKAMHIQEIQNISSESIIQNFPPLEDQNLTVFLNDLNNLNLKELTLNINDYFDKLKTQIMTTIDKIQNETKLKILKIVDLQEQIMGVYNEISSKQDLINLINSDQENTYQFMKQIIEEKFNNISENTTKIKEKIDNYRKEIGRNSFEFPDRIQDHVTFMLNQIDFFSCVDLKIFNQNFENIYHYLNSCTKNQQKQFQLNQNNIHLINFIKSQQYKNSQNQNITRGINNEIEIQKSKYSDYAVSYVDFILDPKKKYIFRIQIETNTKADSYINIGLIQEQVKDTSKLFGKGLSYIERGEVKGISKSIKGGNVFDGKKENINKQIEMRIDLQNKILKVSNYPNYDNVAELDDQNQIVENQEYRLAIEFYFLEHKIKITHFEIVDQFDDKM